MNQKAIIMSIGINALGIARGLGMKGISSILVSNNESRFVASSRFITKSIFIESSDDNDLLQSLKPYKGKGLTLIPATDFYIDFIVRNLTELEQHFAFIIPSKELTAKLIDKKSEVRFMADCNVPIPFTYFNLAEDIIKPEHYPLIVKPKTYKQVKYLGCKNIIVKNDTQLKSLINRLGDKINGFLAQHVIQGPDENLWVCNCTFDRHSNMIGFFSFRRYRTSPAHYGVTSFAISEYSDALKKIVEKIGKKLEYVGPAMVEFKFDPTDGQYKYIEINPRIGMCNFFDTLCGVNNVWATYCVANDKIISFDQQQENKIFLDLPKDIHSRINDKESVTSILQSYKKLFSHKMVSPYFFCNDLMPFIFKLPSNILMIMKSMVKVIIRYRR